jgi:endonuclease III
MNKDKQATEVLTRLKVRYPVVTTALNWQNPWQLLVATVLSAQCTDVQVNKITPVFFRKWPGPYDLEKAHVRDVEEVIRSAGFYRNKAKNLLAAAKIIVDTHKGHVPGSMEELLTLPGVARKTANIVLSNAFGINQGIAVDTHVKRIAFRLGLTGSANPDIVERDLMPLFPVEEWGSINHMLVFFGREVCAARKPGCHSCELDDICSKRGF